jgi:hypothetical protein
MPECKEASPMIPRTLLYKVRSWIDQRVPRDALMINILTPDGKTCWNGSHLDYILWCKTKGPLQLAGNYRILIYTEHMQ